ncbi:MAG: thioredoxin family protein [Ktedonobacteraceae bacterium]|jgi:thioredoxin|nr:thioredoxin family protein [Ktedonobacteraceae bacterium]
MADSYIEVTKDTFAEKVLSIPSSQIVIVNFSSAQSGACQIQDPEFDAVSKELSATYQERALFARVSIEGQDEFTQKWNILDVPAMVFFKDGREIYRITGIVMRERLRRRIEGVLLAN